MLVFVAARPINATLILKEITIITSFLCITLESKERLHIRPSLANRAFVAGSLCKCPLHQLRQFFLRHILTITRIAITSWGRIPTSLTATLTPLQLLRGQSQTVSILIQSPNLLLQQWVLELCKFHSQPEEDLENRQLTGMSSTRMGSLKKLLS